MDVKCLEFRSQKLKTTCLIFLLTTLQLLAELDGLPLTLLLQLVIFPLRLPLETPFLS